MPTAKIDLVSGLRIPICPLDKCWSDETRVFVNYYEGDGSEVFVGTLNEDIPGIIDLFILDSGNGYEISVEYKDHSRKRKFAHEEGPRSEHE